MSANIDRLVAAICAPRAKWQRGEYCDRCQNTGEVDCYCGGDLCVCGQQEIACPRCHGDSALPFDGFEDDY